MFRMLKLNPPNGWRAVGWELAIVTLGVLIALAAQQWAEARSWRGKVDQANAALKDELNIHHLWSVEWRKVTPCLLAQIDSAQRRVMESGATLIPAPVHSEVESDGSELRFVLRIPGKGYVQAAWEAATSDGITARLEPNVRRELNAHYTQVAMLAALTTQNTEESQELLSLSRPVPLDPSARLDLLRTLDRLRGRVEYMDVLSSALIDHIAELGMTPEQTGPRYSGMIFGTEKFCRTQRLPLRPLAAAMRVSSG